MNDYGHVDDDTPSFAISLYKEYRGQGIGSQLMVKMYEKVGFKTVDENVEEYIMVCEL